MSYIQGTTIRIEVAFTDANTNEPVTPDEVILRIDKPGTEQTLELKLSEDQITNKPDNPGSYYADIDTTNGPAGTWHYQFESSGTTKTTSRKQLTIRPRI